PSGGGAPSALPAGPSGGPGAPTGSVLAPTRGSIAPGSPLSYAASLRGVTWGNAVRLLPGGAEAFPAMLAALPAAEHEVLCESYILAHDETGGRFLAAFEAAAARGVMVRVIVDGVGCFGRLPAARLDELARAGVGALVYRPVVPWRRRSGLWRRDHR